MLDWNYENFVTNGIDETGTEIFRDLQGQLYQKKIGRGVVTWKRFI